MIRLEVAFSDVANVTIVVDPSMQVALQRLSRLPWIPIISMSLATPPASPVAGDTYVIASSPTGSWAGQAGKIAEYTTAGWAIISPPDGHGVGLPDGRVFSRRGGVYLELLATQTFKGLVSLDMIHQASGDAFKQASTRVEAYHLPIIPNLVNGVMTIIAPTEFNDDGQEDWEVVGNKVVCKVGARYLFNAALGMNLTDYGMQGFTIGIYRNGEEFIVSSIRSTDDNINTTYGGGSDIRDAALDDYLEFRAYVDGTSVPASINFRSSLSIMRLAVE